jgi:Domain of unknown function (DUF4440)
MRKQIPVMVVVVVLGTLLIAVAQSARQLRQSGWASGDDPIAKQMIQMERDWAEDGCTQKADVKAFLADDFQGTAPGGERYDKAEALRRDTSQKERNCRLDDAKVRFFGDSVAIIYGSERALRTDKDGEEAMHCLVWTDTWLKRKGKWEIVAAQDTAVPCK